MRYLTLVELLHLHHLLIEQSGGAAGIHSMAALESALAQPHMTFAGKDLYPTVADKAAALGFSPVSNHPFADGNKRIGHAAMEVFLFLNGYEIDAPIDEQERVILQLAAGDLDHRDFTNWLRICVVERTSA